MVGECLRLKSSSLDTHISEYRNLQSYPRKSNTWQPQETTPSHNMLIKNTFHKAVESVLGNFTSSTLQKKAHSQNQGYCTRNNK